MPVGVLQIDLHLPHSHSLKEKRMALRSIRDRLRKRFNVSVAELDHQDLWQRAAIGVASIGPDAGYLEEQLARALEDVERNLPECTVHGSIELF
jgi:uncharacterized protein YlxP (DUF503 family)